MYKKTFKPIFGETLDADDLEVFKADLKTAVILAVLNHKTVVVKRVNRLGEARVIDVKTAFHTKPGAVRFLKILEL